MQACDRLACAVLLPSCSLSGAPKGRDFEARAVAGQRGRQRCPPLRSPPLPIGAGAPLPHQQLLGSRCWVLMRCEATPDS